MSCISPISLLFCLSFWSILIKVYSMYQPPHPPAWPGWLCGRAQTEKRPWLGLRWQRALRTLAGLAGHPAVSPAVNLRCTVSLLKSYTQIQNKHLHTLPYILKLDAHAKTFRYSPSLKQLHDHILLLADPVKAPLAADMRDTAIASVKPE